jgi:phosphoribosylanthranilate isomerase
MVAEFGADMIGLNFYPPSPRYLPPEQAAAISEHLRETLDEARPLLAGVFVNATYNQIEEIMNVARLDFAQLSGDESDELLHELKGRGYKAIRPPNKALAIDDAQYYLK